MAPSIMSTLSATYRSRHKVLGYPVDVVDEAGALEVIEAAWRSAKRLHVVTLNAEMVVAAQENQELDRIIRHAHLIVPDGAGVVWALRLSGQQCDRLPGIELAGAALGRAAAHGRRVALLGAKKEVMDAVQTILTKLYPGLNIVYARDGYFGSEEEEAVLEQVRAERPELLLVALGVPRQEFFIDKWQSALPETVMIGVGGSFDVWAGVVKRAPQSFQKLHLEWLYRLISEPWRFKRMSSSLPRFGFQVLGGLLKTRLLGGSKSTDQTGKKDAR